jgi:hypothetical protein
MVLVLPKNDAQMLELLTCQTSGSDNDEKIYKISSCNAIISDLATSSSFGLDVYFIKVRINESVVR